MDLLNHEVKTLWCKKIKHQGCEKWKPLVSSVFCGDHKCVLQLLFHLTEYQVMGYMELFFPPMRTHLFLTVHKEKPNFGEP